MKDFVGTMTQPTYQELLAENSRLKLSLSCKDYMLDDEHVALLVSAAPGLSGMPAMYTLVLYANAGRVCTQSFLADKVQRICGVYPTLDSIRTGIQRARRLIKHWPVSLDPVVNLGYRMTIHDKSWKVEDSINEHFSNW